VAPIVRILDASRRVAQGDFAAKVSTIEGIGDLETLARTFNFMRPLAANRFGLTRRFCKTLYLKHQPVDFPVFHVKRHLTISR